MYPILIPVEGKTCLVIGAGNVAQRRIRALTEAGAAVVAAAPEQEPEVLRELAVTYLRTLYTPALLKQYPAALVFAATNDSAQNEQIVADAQAAGIMASSVTPCTDCTPDFSVPAQRRWGSVAVTASTDGGAPGLSSAICREMEHELADYAAICEPLETLRKQWKAQIADPARRRALLQQMTATDAVALFRCGGEAAYLQYGEACAAGTVPRKGTAVLMISFGTSYAETREKTIGAVEQSVQHAFPEADVYRAFTSRIIAAKMRRNGQPVDSVAQALERLKIMGYDRVYCQPTHVIPGEEYEGLCAAAAPFAACFSDFHMGQPLLMHTEDYPALIDALEGDHAIHASADTAYVLLGHGTAHMANQAYPAFDYWLKQKGYPNVFVGTVEGYPTMETILEQLGRSAYTHVELLPMLLAAGDHVQNDMAGDAPDSWYNVFTRAGYTVTAHRKGLGEYPAVQALYTQKVRKLMEQED